MGLTTRITAMGGRVQDALGTDGWMTRCLVVDEDHDERSALGRLLGKYGFELSETGTADAALRHCRQFVPDVIITTERLGGMPPAEFMCKEFGVILSYHLCRVSPAAARLRA